MPEARSLPSQSFHYCEGSRQETDGVQDTVTAPEKNKAKCKGQKIIPETWVFLSQRQFDIVYTGLRGQHQSRSTLGPRKGTSMAGPWPRVVALQWHRDQPCGHCKDLACGSERNGNSREVLSEEEHDVV